MTWRRVSRTQFSRCSCSRADFFGSASCFTPPSISITMSWSSRKSTRVSGPIHICSCRTIPRSKQAVRKMDSPGDSERCELHFSAWRACWMPRQPVSRWVVACTRRRKAVCSAVGISDNSESSATTPARTPCHLAISTAVRAGVVNTIVPWTRVRSMSGMISRRYITPSGH